jgi:hypothetical protein
MSWGSGIPGITVENRRMSLSIGFPEEESGTLTLALSSPLIAGPFTLIFLTLSRQSSSLKRL